MPVTYNKPNKYDYVTRKAFDRYCDLIDRRRKLELLDLKQMEKSIIQSQGTIARLEQDLDELAQVIDELDLKILHLAKEDPA